MTGIGSDDFCRVGPCKLFDTHCHFDSLNDARDQLPRAYEAGVRAINVIGCDVETTQRSIDVVRMVQDERQALGLDDLDVKATMGLHPHEAQHLGEQKSQLEKLLSDNIDLIAGIGETGYDFFYNHSTQNDQTESFVWQIGLAKEFDRTMVIHTRDAWDDTFGLLEKEKWPSKVVLHCFTGGPKEAIRCVDNGAYISISGIATFKNAQEIRDAIVVTPLERLLCETDAPWLAPVPHRGKLNEPSYVAYVVDQIVEIRTQECGDTREDIVSALFANAQTLFRQ